MSYAARAAIVSLSTLSLSTLSLSALSLCTVALGALAAQTTPYQGSIDVEVLHSVTGTPVSGVSIRLLPLFRTNDPARNATETTLETDAQGRLRFTGLPPGPFQLFIRRAGFLKQIYHASRIPGQPSAGVRLAANQHATAIVHLVPQAVVTGRLVDEDRNPVGPAIVVAWKWAYRNGSKQWTFIGEVGRSDGTGAFRADELEPGRYLLAAPERASRELATPVEIAAGAEIRDIELHVVRASNFRVTGTVTGIPAGAGATVGIVPNDGMSTTAGVNAVVSPGNQFELRGILPGSYTVMARAPLMFASQTVDVKSDLVIGKPLALEPAFAVPVQLSPPLRNTRLVLAPLSPYYGYNTPAGATGPDGRVNVTGLSPGRFRLDIPNLPAQYFVERIRYGGQEVSSDGFQIRGPAPLEAVLGIAGSLMVSARDKDDKPARAVIALIPTAEGGKVMAAESQDDGVGRFDHVPPGVYKLLAWDEIEVGAWNDPDFRKPYEQGAVEVAVSLGQRQTAEVRIQY